jgi:hypothetical protein
MDFTSATRDFMQDLFYPTWQTGPTTHDFGVGAWVNSVFIEPAAQSIGEQQHGWGLLTDGLPGFGTNAEAADVSVSWGNGPPVFTQKTGTTGSSPAWAIPYGSLYNYLKKRLNPPANSGIGLKLFLIGGWDTTTLYGHEQTLKDAISGGT